MFKMSISATGICMDGMGILIMGKSGTGKSRLAMALIARGARLIADDVTFICRHGSHIYATGGCRLNGCLEVRGIGILKGLKSAKRTKVDFVVCLMETYPERMPDGIKYMELAGVQVPVFEMYKDEKFLP
ncbi:MAG: HPr kinase/phosphorylase, partial [Alphaproteobacteria bacterium]